MSTGELRTSTPSAEGVDAAGIATLIDALEAHPGIRPHGLVLLRHGAVIAQGAWAPYRADRPGLLYSLSKSFTSTAAGLARAEGLLELDTPVIEYFPEYDAEVTDPRTRRMTVRHIASMASGHAEETLDRALAAGRGNLIRGFLTLPPDAEPGTLFAYNQPCTYTLAAIVQRASGERLVDYLGPRLFDPLGIRDAAWQQQPPGRDLGFSGLHATADAVARLGQLYLQGGRWGDTQLLDADWVAEATRMQVANPDGGPDWSCGYGLQFWMSRHGYRGDGAFGQFCLVLPEQDAVLALTSESPDMQAVLDLVWELLLPAFDAPPPDAASDARLAERLAGARLATPALAPHPDDPAVWDGAAFPLDRPTGAAASIRGVRLRADGAVWILTLDDADGPLDVPVGHGAWLESAPDGLPLAAAGGWGPGGFVAELAFLAAPHTLRITCPPGGPARTLWLSEPLGETSIRALGRPV